MSDFRSMGEPAGFAAEDLPKTVEEWESFHEAMLTWSRSDYLHAAWFLARTSLYFLVRFVLTTRQWKDADDKPMTARPFILNLCNEVQASFDNVLDVAARGHLKSTIKTLALPIQTLLNSPETTIGIFSYTRALAKGFLRLLKAELESNDLLKALSYDYARGQQLFWSDPDKEADLWSLNEGLIINRSGNHKEASLEAWGLVESMPVGRHFRMRLYDDIVVPATVTTPEQVQKTIEALSLSQALGMPGGQATYTGTFYAASDPHCSLLEQGVVLRLNPCYEITSLTRDEKGQIMNLESDRDKPVLFSHDELTEYTKNMSPSAFGTQMLCDPRAGVVAGFSADWIRYYDNHPLEEGRGKTIYITVDPANAKTKGSDYTAMWVIGLGSDKNYYVLDGIRDRLNMGERCRALFRLHRKWNPTAVLYEKYGMQVDHEYIKREMELQKYRFRLLEVGGNQIKKDDRIEALVPLFESGRFFLPRKLPIRTVGGEKPDLVSTFLSEEYLKWPVSGSHDDMLDSMSRIADPKVHLTWPKAPHNQKVWYEDKEPEPERGSWMVA